MIRRSIAAVLFCTISGLAQADQLPIPRFDANIPAEVGAAAQKSAESGIVKIPDNSGQPTDTRLGRGFNTLSGEFKGECVVGKPTSNQSRGFQIDYSMTQLRSSEEFRRSLQMSASASMGIGSWSGDASSSFFRSLDRNRYYDYLLVNVSVVGPSFSLTGDKLSGDAHGLRNKPKDFYTKCGNQYVKSVTLGGDFTAIITIETDNEIERSELRAALSVAAVGYGSGKASFAENLSRVTKNYKRTVKILRKGTNEAVPDLSIDALIQYSLDFPTKINRDTAYPISFDKASFTDIDVRIPRFQKEEILADDWATRAGELYSDYADLIYYRDNSNRTRFYPPLSDEQVATGITKLSSMVNNVKAQYVGCLEDPGVACSKMAFPERDLTLPKRAQRAGLDAKIGAAQFIGVVGTGETKTVSVLGEWSAWDNGEGLWWPPEKCCFSVVVSPAFGPTYEKPYTGPTAIQGPARVSIKIGDSTYGDNRSRDLAGLIY